MSDISNDTTFSDKTTVIEASWLNVINTFFHTLFAGAETAAEARTAISSAKSGANSDITSITGLTTDLTVAQGGTGASTLTDGGILLGSGTGAITATAVLADGEILVGDGTTDPVAESGATARTSLGAAASGANSDITSLTALTTADATTSYKISGTKVVGAQAVAEADVGAITSYTAHASGSEPVTSNAATDLDTTAAALATLEDEVAAMRTTVNSLLAKLRTHGIIAT